MVTSDPPTPAGPSPDPAALRVGDTERNAAVGALGEHLTSGRLDLDEFGVRSAKASSARTVGELSELFADLPAPHPPLPTGAAPAPGILRGHPVAGPARPAPSPLPAVPGASPALVDARSTAQKFVAAAAGSAGIVALILFLTIGGWWWFLLISSVAGGIWGDSWKRPDRRG